MDGSGLGNGNLRQWLRSLRNATTYSGVAMITLIWGALLFSQQTGETNFLRAQRENADNLVRAYEESVVRSVSEIDKTLLLMRSRIVQSVGRINIHDVAQDPLYSSDIIKYFGLVDANGFTTASNSSGIERFDVRDREYYREFRADPSDRLYISKPVIGRIGGQWIMLFARPILGPDGSLRGVLDAIVDPDALTHFFETIDIGKEGKITLLGEDGYVRAAKGGTRNVLGQYIDSPLQRMYPATQNGFFYAQAFDGVRRLVAFRKIKGFPLIGAVGFSEKELLGALLAQQKLEDLVACGITILIFVGIGFNARHRAKLDAAHEAVRLSEAETLAKSRELEITLEHMSQGLMMVDVERNIPVINHQAVELLGLPENFLDCDRTFDDLMGCLWEQGDFGKDGETLEPRVRDFVKAGGLVDIGTYERTRPNGTMLEVCSVPLPGGGLVRTFTDITARKHNEARIAHMARHDELTGLANRMLFRERIDQAIARSRRTGELFAVLLLDLDHFKDVNDTLGHAAGDILLKIAAHRLCRCVRETDVVARLGGDEFAIIQASIGRYENTQLLCNRIMDAIKRTYEISNHIVEIGTSIGIAVAPGDGFDAETLLKKADIALYAVKSHGRGGSCFFEPAMEANAQARRALEYDLRKALKAGEFELLYQPMIDLASNNISGFEALLRWNHPQRGVVSPGEFIPVAEDVGLISDIGEWVLATACAAAVNWPDAIKVAVNLSPSQFKDGKVVEVVKASLLRAGLPAMRLELEITESVILQEDQSNLATLQDLRDLGIECIALDDFGTGYSSLSHLRAFSFSKIKIDKSFVMELGRNPDCLAIVRAVADLGKSLNLPTIAEGVETQAQLEQVRALGCQEAQGFLFSRPIPAGEVERVIARQKLVVEHAA